MRLPFGSGSNSPGKPGFKLRLTPHPGKDDEDGWALTLADMMTLLLTFFVVLLSIAKVDQQSYQTVAQTMQKAMGGPTPTVSSETPDQLAVATAKLFTLQRDLTTALAGDAAVVSVKLRPDAVALELDAHTLFASGSAELTPRADEIVDRIAATIPRQGLSITVEGHTDNVPISSERFPSNWELSSARASSVARQLIAQGMDRQRLSVMGLADTRPLASNATAAGRALNRRVVVLLKPIGL